MNKLGKPFFMALSLALFAASMAVAGTDLQQGVALYNKGDYKGCVAILTKGVAGAERANPAAHYYLANALTALNQKTEARSHYEAVLRLAPTGQLHDFAEKALARLGGGSSGATQAPVAESTSTPTRGSGRGMIGVRLMDEVANEIDAVAPASPAEKAGLKAGDLIVSVDGQSTLNRDGDFVRGLLVGREGTSVTVEVERRGKRFRTSLQREGKVNFKALAGVRGTKAPEALDKVDAAMISTFRDSSDTKIIYREVAHGLTAIPKSVKDDLLAADVKIMIAPSICDARPDLKGTRPGGYVHGGDYENCPGMFDPSKKTLYIAERAQYRSGPRELNHGVVETTLHELGHAYDFTKANISDSEEFRKAYVEDSGHLTNTLRERYYYYTQDHSGQAELFAQLFAKANGATRDSGLDRAFPSCFGFIKRQIGR